MSGWSGWKTYAAAVITALFALLGSTLGLLDVGQTAALLAIAAGFAGLRNAQTTERTKLAAEIFNAVVPKNEWVQQIRREIEAAKAAQPSLTPLQVFDPDRPPPSPAG